MTFKTFVTALRYDNDMPYVKGFLLSFPSFLLSSLNLI